MRLITAAKLELLCACFVILYAGVLSAQEDRYDKAVSAGGKWTVSRAEDPMTAEKRVHLQLPADNSVAGEEPAQINLYCTNGKLKLADFHPKGSMSEKYGVYLADKGITGRAIAIVNKAGKIAWFKNYDIPVVPDLNEVAAALGQVKAATA